MQMKKLPVAISAVLAVVLAGLAIGPQRISSAHEATGDLQLARSLSEHAPAGSRNLAAFTIDGDTLTFAGVGADEHTEFEIGSITKTFTAELLRNAIDRGELTLDTTIGEILHTDSDITLGELATHTSGLPRTTGLTLPGITWQFFGNNPYGPSPIDQLLQDAGSAKLTDRGHYRYSNFGVAVLGQLLALNSGRSYEELLNTEILEPLGMHNTYLMLPQSVSDSAPRGVLTNGRTSAPWEMEADAPAGAIRSTAYDMSLFARYIMDTKPPDFTWVRDTEMIWHNGATGGFSSYLGFIQERQRVAFVVNDSGASVDNLGLTLLRGDLS